MATTRPSQSPRQSTGRQVPSARTGASPALTGEPHDVDDAPRDRLSGSPVSDRALGLLLAVGGALGFVSAFILTVERFRLAENPHYVPSCSINPYISCGTVMASHEGALFGFPNPLLGIGAFAVSTTLGLLLLSGVVLPRWIHAGLGLGITLGMAFVIWLIASALYSIHALCPYCLLVWAVVIPTFWTVTLDNLDRGVLPVPAGARRVVGTLVDYRLVAVVASYAVVVLLVGIAFWSYWSTLL